ncbi:hypothetical protein CDAR_85891 [Caerostris darwini]|uniref:Uncharacterized protein n=1 Tax=Caerostris darwini TaxID=1538125 RepID=A0AAV4RU94_9ARAC|nr:hypothetical protein CDAR_85891 [Caerostris darwini]
MTLCSSDILMPRGNHRTVTRDPHSAFATHKPPFYRVLHLLQIMLKSACEMNASLEATSRSYRNECPLIEAPLVQHILRRTSMPAVFELREVISWKSC